MLTTDQTDSPIFRRLTNRLRPKLTHPTARAFDIAEWREVTRNDVLSRRDETLARTAGLIGLQMKVLREQYLATIFGSLSRAAIIDLSVADANRAWTIIRWKVHEAIRDAAARGSAGYYSAMGEVGIPIGHEGALVSPEDANNASVDSLPHWFAAAVEAAEEEGPDPPRLDVTAVKAQLAFNLEHAYRDVWQEVLWEHWTFAEDDENVELSPDRPEDMGRWRAWDWREQSLAMQGPIMSRNIERGSPDLAIPLALTAAIDENSAVVAIPPTADQSAGHRSAFEILERSYLSIFLDQEVGGVAGMTPRLLEGVVSVLQDLAELRLPADTDPATYDEQDIERLRCATSRVELRAVLAAALHVPEQLADKCLAFLTSDPFGDLSPLFTTGLWHRPLVSSRDGATLMLVAGALVWGSPLRRAERWLQAGSSADLTATPNGILFEADYRERLDLAIRENPILAAASSGVRSIAAGQALEEIDLLFRVGSTVVVGEVKCLLAPSEPIERFDYVRKLKDACGQARRKADWLRDNPDEAARRVGQGAGPARYVPLVVVNQSTGVEWRYHDCLVTDARFLELFLSAGSFNSAAALFGEEGTEPVLFTRELYASAEEAEAVIPGIFGRIPGMDPFRDAIAWGETAIPLCDGRVLRMGHPMQDVEAYIAAMPGVGDLPHGGMAP